jgi:transcriptional regulator with XRE-family HTH domain
MFPRVARRKVIDEGNTGLLGQEPLAQVRADEHGATGDHDPIEPAVSAPSLPCYRSSVLTELGTAPTAVSVETQPRTFGQRLRACRLQAGLSQSALEGLSGIPKARLSRYENGHVVPSIETLGRLARALGCSEASLLGDSKALVQDFVDALYRRGVRMYSSEQAVTLANAVADILEAAAPPMQLPEAEPSSVATASLARDARAAEPELLPVPPA